MATMFDIYLKAENEVAFKSKFPFLWDANEGDWILGTEEFSFDPIGPVLKKEGTYTEEGELLTPPVIDNSFHANLRANRNIRKLVPESLKIKPSNPVREWA